MTSCINRRNLLKAGGATVLGAAAGLAQASSPCAEIPKKWDVETDVLVIGSGGAGLAAAVSAKEQNVDVTVMEKLSFVGGNTMLSSGYFNCADPERQNKQNIKDSVKHHIEQTLAAGDYRANPKLVEVLCSNGLDTLHWLEGLGMKFRPTVMQVYGSLWPRSHLAVENKGAGYIRVLKAKCDEKGVHFLMGTKLKEFIREGQFTGRVLGVEATDSKGKTIYVRARKGIVLATGGFAANAEMRSRHDPRLRTLTTTNNTACSTGEGLIAANKVGAYLIGMDYIQCNPGKAPGHQNGVRQSLHLDVSRYIYVDQRGHRFVAEDERRDVLRDAVLNLPEKYGFCIVDKDGFDSYNEAVRIDARKGLETGDAFTAESLEDLAKQLKIPPENLKKTVEEYNRAVDQKKDTAFGKHADQLTHRIEKAPFWAAFSAMAAHHTMGGVQIDEKARVVDAEQKVIPGLYAAGEVTGGIHGSNRVGGNAILDVHVFGRIAGRSAATMA